MALEGSRIRLNVTGARGPRGLASGPLGAGSVDAETITDDSGEQTAIIEKLSYGAGSVKDALDAASTAQASAVRDMAVEGDWGASQSLEFASRYVEGETPVQEARSIGSVTIEIGEDGDLEVVSAFDDATKRVLIPSITFAEGRLLFQVRRGSNAANSKFMLQIEAPDGNTRAVWSSDGALLSYGLIPANGSTSTVLGSDASAFVGTADQLVWIELITGPMFDGLDFTLRAWVDEGSRPADVSAISGPYDAADIGDDDEAGEKLNSGRLRVSSFSTVPTRLTRVQVSDGSQGTRLTGQAYLVGRWFSRYEAAGLVMATSRTGSKLRSRLTGSADWNLSYVVTPHGQQAALDVFVNGVRYNDEDEPIILDGTAGTLQGATLVEDLDPAVVTQIEIRVRGVDVFSNMWYRGAGVLIRALVPVTAGGAAAPWPDNRPKALFIGDSITMGSVARGNIGGDPAFFGGDVAWPVLACESAGLQCIINGFGGTGLTVPNSGGTQPSADLHAFNYMHGRPIDTAAENIKIAVLSIGVNDDLNGVSTSAFQAAYKTFLQRLLKAHPGIGRILAMYPFSGEYATQIFNAVGALNDPRILVVDTQDSSWDGITYVDGLHPDVPGHALIAGVAAPVLRNALAGISGVTTVQIFQLLYGAVWLYPVVTRFPSGLRTVAGRGTRGDRRRTAFWFVAFSNVGFVARWAIYPNAMAVMSFDEIAMWCGLYVLSAASCIALMWAGGIEDER